MPVRSNGPTLAGKTPWVYLPGSFIQWVYRVLLKLQVGGQVGLSRLLSATSLLKPSLSSTNPPSVAYEDIKVLDNSLRQWYPKSWLVWGFGGIIAGIALSSTAPFSYKVYEQPGY